LSIDKLLGILHEIVEKDKGQEIAFRRFRSPIPINVIDMEVNPLYVIFDLKWVLVGKIISELITYYLHHLI